MNKATEHVLVWNWNCGVLGEKSFRSKISKYTCWFIKNVIFNVIIVFNNGSKTYLVGRRPIINCNNQVTHIVKLFSCKRYLQCLSIYLSISAQVDLLENSAENRFLPEYRFVYKRILFLYFFKSENEVFLRVRSSCLSLFSKTWFLWASRIFKIKLNYGIQIKSWYRLVWA